VPLDHVPLDHVPLEADEVGILSDRDARQILPYEADDSPFPEVRAVVRPVDDASLPCDTVRMWTIGLVFTIVSPESGVRGLCGY
jgi:hypothetical protein